MLGALGDLREADSQVVGRVHGGWLPANFGGCAQPIKSRSDTGILVAAKGEVFVQFWLRPGKQAAFFDLGNDPPVDPIPAELRRFL